LRAGGASLAWWHVSWTRAPCTHTELQHRLAVSGGGHVNRSHDARRLKCIGSGLALGVGLITRLATAAHAADCVIGYPYVSTNPRTSVVFNESEVLRGFSPVGQVAASPGLTIQFWYSDEHAMVLGVRQVQVKSKTGTKITDYALSPLPGDPGSVLNPQVGTT